MDLIKVDGDLTVTREWYDFINKGIKPNSLPKEVVMSWERCKNIGIDPYGGKSEKILESNELDQKLSENMYIINTVRPFLEELFNNNIPLDGYLAFITDKEGNLLFIDGDRKTVEEFKHDINFFVGASWSEEAVGTTAVSLAYHTGAAIPFVSQEKYCCKLKQKACCSIPIKNKENKIIAILGIAANFPNPDSNVFNMLLYITRSIESLLRMAMLNEKLGLVNTCYKKLLSSVSDPIVIIDNNGIIVELNDKAKEVIGAVNRDIRGTSAKDILGYNPLLFNTSNVKIINSNLVLRQMVPVFDNSNNLTLGIGFLESKTKKNKANSTIYNNVKFSFDDIIGTSAAIKEAKKIAKAAAHSDFNVLIQGDSGTGKELFAQAIHNESDRRNGPFIAVNCGAIPENLVESEFFGYEGGSFTGADKKGKPGKFELANGGTIFLDEIGEMAKNLQTILLRVLQEKEVVRIGGHNPIPVDVRVISATNKNLADEVKSGNFREDLFWRINVIPVFVPPLKDRKGDVKILIEHFIDKYSEEHTKLIFHPTTLDILNNYDWPGNIRELENLVKRLLVFTDGEEVLPSCLPDHIKFGSDSDTKIVSESLLNGVPTNIPLRSIEKAIIQHSIVENNYNISETARKLGISRNTIYNKLGVENVNSC